MCEQAWSTGGHCPGRQSNLAGKWARYVPRGLKSEWLARINRKEEEIQQLKEPQVHIIRLLTLFPCGETGTDEGMLFWLIMFKP